MADLLTIEDLDWEHFTAAYFPGRHRHDLEALTAYAAYRRSGVSPDRPSAEAQEHAAALEVWENEGGPVR